jgi:chromosomal replication initiator protein
MINSTNTFETFIVGPENELAYSAAVAVASDPGRIYNPLLIYGNTGLGKTHLMHAVAHNVMRKNPSARIECVASEVFTDEYRRADGTPFDGESYRNADVLLIEGIHFLSGKVGIQEGLLDLFEHLHANHRQIILTSDRPVREIKEVSDRLVSRFQGGMTVDMQAPELGMRMAIVDRKARERGVMLTPEVIEYLAKRITDNVRSLEGALTRLACCSARGGHPEITVADLERLLRDVLVDEGCGQVNRFAS